ncbi:hypothetical protein EUTSA_v10017448mg [Eutrema salsugineum]|uniref:Uncharacterized protein n=1 Tax=Eutrema salsugineum TaxID=72664 RepID=V4MI49_EUTSA|nr:uncharacterized protein LOC18027661 [Eutrema salsugineum]ESQ52253.1 hypothetical protein EUTSA_v10017448mg [Eutrema salsugineum]
MTRRASYINIGTEDKKQEANEPKHDGEGGSEEPGEEDDLFEINLDAVNDTTSSPPSYDWQRFPARTGSVLLANCLLPAADISCAVPATSRAWSDLVSFRMFLYVENIGIESKEA